MPVAIALLCTGRLLCGYPLPDARGTPAAPGAAVQVARGDSLYAQFRLPAARAAYAAAGVTDRLGTFYEPGPHQFSPAMREAAYAWLDRWLKTPAR